MFQNPHGLDDHEDHFSSAYDMALLTQYAMKSEKYQTIASTKSHRVDGEQVRVWRNKNRLLTELYSNSTGGKTGFTKRAKRTLVSTAQKDGDQYVVVTLNAPSDWHDHMNLFEWAFENYDTELIIEEGIVKNIDHSFENGRLFVERSFFYPLTEAEKKEVDLTISLEKPNDDNRNGQHLNKQVVGKYTILLYNEEIGSVPIYYEAEVEEKKSFWSIFRNVFSLFIGVESI
ncbi:D-alanyl-D-alanine carboxypeptidase family protein [Bacillus sp. JCM 19034]|uniref:D-alanyl-D-alanine carboxypeptidase family protein n=1 Tax=Bacillus sp. JCM 19034 TaxID=1481928 RepID=UPI000A711EF0